MSDKLKNVAEAATPIVEVVTGAKAASGIAPVVVEAGGEMVDVVVEVVDSAPVLSKKVMIVGATLLLVSAGAGVAAYWAARRKNVAALKVDEVAEEVAHKVVEETAKAAK